MQLSALLAQDDAGHNSGTRGSQATPEGNGVLDVHMRLDGKASLVVASQHVQRDSSEQVRLWVEADVTRVLAFSFVRDAAVERILGFLLGPVDGDVQLQVHGQGETDNIEPRADVGAGARRPDDEGFNSSHGEWTPALRRWAAGVDK